MKMDFSAPDYYCNAYWLRRPETAAGIADRYARYLDRLAPISPFLVDWIAITQRAPVPMATARRNLVAIVEDSREPDDFDGKIYQADGFTVSAYTQKQAQNFQFRGFVARDYGLGDMNSFQFSTPIGQWPDLSVVTYSLFRSVVLATIACWEPLYCSAQPSTLQPFEAKNSWFHVAWFTYVHPSLVHRVATADIPVVEPTPDGGLLLAATTDTFDADNPAHIEGARRIAAATSHLNDVMPPL